MELDDIICVCAWIFHWNSVNLVMFHILKSQPGFTYSWSYSSSFSNISWVLSTFRWFLGVYNLTSVTWYIAGFIAKKVMFWGQLKHWLFLGFLPVLDFCVFSHNQQERVIYHPELEGVYIVHSWILGTLHMYTHALPTSDVMSLFFGNFFTVCTVDYIEVLISGYLVFIKSPILSVWS